MSNSAAASTDPLHEVKTWMQSKKPADIKLAVDAFPKLMVRLWLKEQTAADAAAANSGSTVQTKKPPILFFETARFPLDRNWELLESFRNFKCRFSLQPSDPLQHLIIENILNYNKSQLASPPDLALEEIKSQDLSAMDFFLLCFCTGLREAYHRVDNCNSLQLSVQKLFKVPQTKDDPQREKWEPVAFDYKQYCDKMMPLPDSISCAPTLYLKHLCDNMLKPDSNDEPETRNFKERSFARLCSLLVFLFKVSNSSSKDDDTLQIRQNALLAPLCFLPLVSVVCHKILNAEVNKNQKFLCHTDQSDTRVTRPYHSLVGYIAAIPSRSQANPSKDGDDAETDRENLWNRFLPSVTDPNQYQLFTKLPPSDRRLDCAEGRYVSTLSHYVHLLLDAVKADYLIKKKMYSVHLDNLVCTIWAATMFPWIITQKPAVKLSETTDEHANVPFRRDFENLRCQVVPYLHDDLTKTPGNLTNTPVISQTNAFDDAERFAVSFSEQFYEVYDSLKVKCLLKIQARASHPKCLSECSKYAICLLVFFFGLPWIQSNVWFYLYIVFLTLLSAYLSLLIYFLWRMISVQNPSSFSQMTRESTDAIFQHRWATEYTQWTMKSEHSLLASQARFFEYLSQRLNNDAKDIKDSLKKPGYIQWIDTLECVFHDSTAKLNWACNAEATFLKRSFTEVFQHAKQQPSIQTFVPTIVCIVRDEIAHGVFCTHRDSSRIPQLSSRIQELSAFFRHHIRVGVISESHVSKRQSLLEQVTDLTPLLKFFNFQYGHRNGPDFDSAIKDLKRIFGSEFDTNKLKTFAIIPAISGKKSRQYTIGMTADISTSSSTSDFLDDLCTFKAQHGSLNTTKSFLVIGLKKLAGRDIMAAVKFADFQTVSDLRNALFWDPHNGQSIPTPDPGTYSEFLYGIISHDLLIEVGATSSMGFRFFECLCKAVTDASYASGPRPTERMQTVVKQAHSFSDKLRFKVSKQMSSWEAFSEVRSGRSLEPVVSDRSGKELLLPFLRSPWVSRPAFPRPTLGSPFFMLFLTSRPPPKFGGKPGEYLLESSKDDLDFYLNALRQLGKALLDVRGQTVQYLDPQILKQKSFLLFKWNQFVDMMPWRNRSPIPPRDVLFRMRICASTLMDVSWWLSVSETSPSLLSASRTTVQPSAVVQSYKTTSFSEEVANLEKEILYLHRLQNLLEVTILHLKMCVNALHQLHKVHYDEHLGHVQLWEFLQKNDLKGDLSRVKHICRQYIEKISNVLLLAGVSTTADFQTIASRVPPVKYLAFRDQMMHRFSGTWNTVQNHTSRGWKDAISQPTATNRQPTAFCCQGDFPQGLSGDWTQEAGLLFQDVLGRLYDHSSAVIIPSATATPLDVRQAGICQLLNATKGASELKSLRSCELKSLRSYLQNWSVAGNKAFLESSNKLGSDFSAVLKTSPQHVSSPFQFLFILLKLFHDAHNYLNSPSPYYQQHPSIATLQDAILFMGERDAYGNFESSKPGILQILDSEWNFHSISDKAEKTEPGLLADLETTCRLVDQRIKVCRSRILTLTGKEKRAQQLKEDPSYRLGHSAPQDAVRRLLWRVLDWYSQQFNDHWGFPTSCDLGGVGSSTKGICYAIDSGHTSLNIGEIAHQLAGDNCVFIPVSVYAFVVFIMWFLDWKFQYAWLGSSFVAVIMMTWLFKDRGKVNLPWVLARFRIIEPHDVHHGINLAAFTNLVFFGSLAFIALWYSRIVTIDPYSVFAAAVQLICVMALLVFA